jgi:hypothetical protein
MPITRLKAAANFAAERLRAKARREERQQAAPGGDGGLGEAWPQKRAPLGRLMLRRCEKRKGSKAVVLGDEEF